MSSSSSASSAPTVDGVVVSSHVSTPFKLPRLTATSYSKWKPEGDNCLKRAGLKENDYKKEIKGFIEMKGMVVTFDDQDNALALEYVQQKSSSSSSSSTSTVTVDKNAEEIERSRKILIKGIVERSGKAYYMLYECLADEIKLLVNNNKSIIDGYGYSLWKFLEDKYQSTESDSLGKLWNDFVNAKQTDDELFDEYKARVDSMVELLNHAGDIPHKALYATILMDRMVPRYNQMKMIIDSTKELGKDRKNIDWVVVTKYIQQQERSLARQSEDGTGDDSAQAMTAAVKSYSGSTYSTKLASGGNRNSAAPGRNFNLTSAADLPYRGQASCWCCGIKGHSFRTCKKWLARNSNARGRTPGNTTPNSAASSRSASPTRGKEFHRGTAAAAAASAKPPSKHANKNEEDESDYDSGAEGEAQRKESFAVMFSPGNTGPRVERNTTKPSTDKTSKKIRFDLDKQGRTVHNTVTKQPKSILKILSSLTATAAKMKSAERASDSNGNHGLDDMNWGVDSMASVHITGNKAHLQNIRKGRWIKIKTADNGMIDTNTVGDVKISMNCANGEIYTFTLPAVYYHEAIAANLISGQRLRGEGFEITLGRYNKGSWMYTPDGKRVALNTRNDLTILEQKVSRNENNLVYLADIRDATADEQHSALATEPKVNHGKIKTADDLIHLHHKLGHCAWSTLKRAINKGNTEGMGKYQLSKEEEQKALQSIVKCEVCLEAAGQCTNYGTRGLDHGNAPAEVLHMDTYYSKEGRDEASQYEVIMRDPYGGILLANHVTHRDEESVSKIVMDRIKFLERQLDVKVKRLYADGGGEFINGKLKNYCQEKGIAIHWPPADKHQLNGSAESCVRVAKYGARKLLIASGLPDRFSRYAVQHFIFIYNRITISKYTGKTPYEIIMGKKPSCEHWGTFGCDVKYHIPKRSRPTTYSPTMLSGIYLGHDSWRNCARVYSMETKKFLYTRDVKYLNTFNYAKVLTLSEIPVPLGSEEVISEDTTVNLNTTSKAPTGYPSEAEFDSIPENEEVRYEVEQVIGHRMRRGRKEYQVKWVGYPVEQSTWQPASQLIEDGCKKSIDRYEAVIHGNELEESADDSEEEVEPVEDVNTQHEERKEELKQAEVSNIARDKPVSEECIEPDLTGDEGKRQAIADMALCAFSAGFERKDATEAAKVKRSELIMAISSGLAELEKNTPKSYKEAIRSKHSKEWIDAMKVEWNTLVSEGVWDYVTISSLPVRSNILPSKFVFKVKLKEDGTIDKFKARLVAGGHKQIHGVDFNEVYASTGKYKTLRIMMSLAAKMGYDLHQMDVPAAFVKGSLAKDENVYMQIPEPYRVGREGQVLKLKKSLYGLHQAGRNWYLLAVKFLTKVLGFKQSVSDPSFFFKRSRSGRLMTIFLFVDDFQACTAPQDREEWNEYVELLKKEFNIKCLGEPSWLLGMKITRDRKRGLIKLDQELYISKALERFGFTDCRVAETPEEMKSKSKKSSVSGLDDDNDESQDLCDRNEYMEKVGTLIYAAISTRPDISHAVYQCAKYMQKPTKQNMKAIDRVFRYLAGTKKVGLIFGSRNLTACNNGFRTPSDVAAKQCTTNIAAYSDADWGNNEDRKSLSGWVVKLNGDPISWSCKKQSVVSQSTCEAELYAEAAAINEVLWLRDLIGELEIKLELDPRLNIREESGVVVYCDNQSTIKVSKNGIKADRTKHVDIKYHFITDVINEGKVTLKWVPTERQEADIFTKALPGSIFIKHRRALMYEDELINA